MTSKQTKRYWLLVLLAMALPATAAVPSSIQRFVDGVVERSIVERETAGATVALVANGRLLMVKGYGLADVSRGTPVAGRVSQFRIGSITKVLTWISVLQQVEAGNLDLDADLNTYLQDFAVPRAFSETVTLRHLMTHTAGFEDNLIGLFVSGPRQMGTLAEELRRGMPRRIYPPGQLAGYSNYGAGLAGHIVARVAGTDWHDYVEDNVLRPLSMSDTTTRQPVSEAIEASRARGYTVTADGFEEQGFVYIPLAPAGSGTATALDMARLMVELLNPAGTSVLSAASKTQLMSGAFIAAPEVNGMTLGMYEMTRGGTRAVGHAGNTLLFDSLMVLWPEERMGLFVAANTMGGTAVTETLAATLADELGFTGAEPALEDVGSARSYAGTYVTARRNLSNFTKIMALLNTVTITVDEQAGTLWVQDGAGRRPFKQLADGVYQHVNGVERIVFQDGAEPKLYFSDQPMFAFLRLDTSESFGVTLGVLLAWSVLALGVIVLWPIAFFFSRRASRQRGQAVPVLLTVATTVLSLFFFWQLAQAAGGNAYDLLLHGFKQIPSLLWYPFVVSLLVVLRLLYLYRVWAEGYWWMSRRLHFTLLLFADGALVWWFWQWNLLPETLLAFVK